MGFVLGEDDRKEEEKRIACRLAIRKKGKKTAANAAASSHQERKRRANARAYESDDEEFVAEACKAEKKAKRGGGPRAGSFAVKLPQEDAALAGATEHSGKKGGGPKEVDRICAGAELAGVCHLHQAFVVLLHRFGSEASAPGSMGQCSPITGYLRQGSREATTLGVMCEALPDYGGMH